MFSVTACEIVEGLEFFRIKSDELLFLVTTIALFASTSSAAFSPLDVEGGEMGGPGVRKRFWESIKRVGTFLHRGRDNVFVSLQYGVSICHFCRCKQEDIGK